MKWTAPVIRELAERRCAIFLGAGASAGSMNSSGHSPPDWKSFLERLLNRMGSPHERLAAKSLIDDRRYLEAAEVIRADVSHAEFTQFIRDELVVPRYSPSPVHKSVLDIDPKIVITTNYDNIYEDYCRTGDAVEGYNVCRYYETHLVSDLRSPVRVIVKAHGCVSDPSKIVLTRSEYFEQRRQHERFFRVLDGIFITSTLLFIGYSLSDPDVQLVLENANIAAPRSHPHYAVVGSDVHPALKRSWENAYNIHFIEYPAGKFDILNEGLTDLARQVNAFRETHIA